MGLHIGYKCKCQQNLMYLPLMLRRPQEVCDDDDRAG